MKVQDNQHFSIEQIKEQYLSNSKRSQSADIIEGQSFKQVFDRIANPQKEDSLKFSKHAASRLATRDITLDMSQMDRLKDGVSRAEEKGIKDSLMIMDRLAFIVNVPSQTVITAMDSTESKEQIFTNIDGAVIV